MFKCPFSFQALRVFNFLLPEVKQTSNVSKKYNFNCSVINTLNSNSKTCYKPSNLKVKLVLKKKKQQVWN